MIYVGLQLGSVCVHFTLGDPQQLPKTPAQKYPPAEISSSMAEVALFRRPGLSGRGFFLQPTHCAAAGTGLFSPCHCSESLPQSPKMVERHTTNFSAANPATGRFDLCHGSHEVRDCRAVTRTLPELPYPRILPLGLSLISG